MVSTVQTDARDDELLGEIRARVARALRDDHGGDPHLTDAPAQVLAYPNSFMLRFPAQGTDCEAVLVKIRRHPKMQTVREAVGRAQLHVRMREEYDSLCELHALFGGAAGQLDAVKPFAYLDRYHGIVMQEFAPRTLRGCIMADGRWLGGRQMVTPRFAESAGHWLRRLHDASDAQRASVTAQALHAQDLAPLVSGLRDVPGARKAVARVEPHLAEALGDIADDGWLTCRTAEDFTTDNVLCADGGRIAVVDVKLREASPWRDLALLAVHPETYRVQFLSKGTYLRPAALRAFRRAIVRGYGEGAHRWRRHINYYCARTLLEKWLMYERIVANHQGLKGALTGRVAVGMRRYFARRAFHYLGAETIADT